MDKERLSSLLQRHDRERLKAKVLLKVIRHLAYQPHKRRLAEQEIGGLLVLPAHGSTLQCEGARGIQSQTAAFT